MKVLFLDIDGVLNTDRTHNSYSKFHVEYFSDLEYSCLENLQSILLAHPDCRIIIHSAWREELKAFRFKEIFNTLGYSIISDSIFGCTNPELSKADSIFEYVQALRLKNYVIVDDDILFNLDENLNSRQYKTSLSMGLTTNDVAKISLMLNETY